MALGQAGAKVACVARSADKLDETVAAIRAAGGTAEAYACDVTDGESVQKVVDAVVEKWEKLDILVNNAGVTRDTLLPRMQDDDWDAVINTNLRGTFLFTRALTRPMMQARYGRIINISSVSGLMGNPGQANYSASKAGMIGLTRTVAKELASRKVTVNAVAPGFIETEMTGAPGADGAGRSQEAHSGQASGQAGGNRLRGAVPGQRGGQLHHRANADGRRRHDVPRVESRKPFRAKAIYTLPPRRSVDEPAGARASRALAAPGFGQISKSTAKRPAAYVLTPARNILYSLCFLQASRR